MKIFILDDESSIRKSLRDILEDEEYEVKDFSNSNSFLKYLDKNRPDVVLLDVWLEKEDGLEILEKIKVKYPILPVIMISGHGNIEISVNAIKQGAFSFLEKPLSIEKVLDSIKIAQKYSNHQKEEVKLEIDPILGNSPAIQKVKFAIYQAATTNARVFIYGENGTGKELIAKAIFQNSHRNKKPFIALNCAALPEELIESELFGYVKGAFTGALENKIGKFEIANNGTLFLDEICDMSLSTQAKVLRILQEQIFERLGSNKSIQVNVRVIAATNVLVEEAIKEKKFREDLYYRLNVIHITVPPLRDRKEDIPILTEHFLKRAVKDNQLENKTIDEKALKMLQSHYWKGNVRELKNIIERLSIMTVNSVITEKDVEDSFNLNTKDIFDLKTAKINFEKDYIIKIMKKNNDEIEKTAIDLNISKKELLHKIKEMEIKTENK